MAFTARTFTEILEDMIAYVKANTEISDFSVGSVARTILEAASLEDDELYFQMVQLLEIFSINSATGKDLDARVADFNIFRRGAKAANGYVRIGNSNLISEETVDEFLIGETEIQLFSTASFPENYPYTIRAGEGTSSLQDLIVTNNDILVGTLTLSTPLIKDLPLGSRVSYVDPSGSVINIGVGVQVQVPASVGSSPRTFTTQNIGTILPGNYWSNEIRIKADQAGRAGNITSSNKITQFSSSSPFSGAIVKNTRPTGGGLERQTDEELRTEALQRIQSLSRGTPLALKTGALGVTDPVTGRRVISSSLLEDFTRDEVVVYVDDGTGLIPSVVNLPASSTPSALAGDTTLELIDSNSFPTSGWILIESDGSGNPGELVEFEGKVGNELILSSPLINDHFPNAIVNLVQIITDAAESAQERFELPNYPVVRSSERLWYKADSDPWEELSRDVDFKLNRSTGELRLVGDAGAALDSKIVANYDYYTSLISRVTRTLEGDPNDVVNFPGVKAAGVFLSVEAPSIRRVTVTATIKAKRGVSEGSLAPLVKSNIENYIRSLGVGEDVIQTKIIDVAHNVAGLEDIFIKTPSNNIVILENELPVPFDSAGNSLVSIG